MAPERALVVRGSGPGGARLAVFLLLAAAGLWAALVLDLDPRRLWPGREGWQLGAEFFGRALRPALAREGADLPPDLPPLWWQATRAAWRTVSFAAAAMLPALAGGLLLGFGGATAWWAGGRRSWLGPAVTAACRLASVGLRSVHELLWAVLLLAVFGVTPLAAVVALALPYAGTLGKIFAELIDEAPRGPAGALRDAGALPVQVFLFGLLPRALPDMTAYSLYRFECALRSAAVLGFFGFPTLGYYISASFENLYYGEVWFYLYVLLALVAGVDWWSGAIRRRLGR
ncbi:MAG TPA: ABC transporter permease subunit [Candidatus Krumholzibacteria bacterium]|nr:ABC transporter permease subunit [Candidatus Krumholzibacteria bacterium]HPD72536.1 ABC transporter permease subunit [Candidatus Krumholzibacteria bacterium]HRY40532.1 ABC transporter permease subunit [Candidatus Krumholzibacteria bacterium]